MNTKSFWLAWDKHLTLSSCKWLSSWTCHLTLSCCKCVGCWTCSLLPHEKGQHHVAQPAGEDASDWSLSYSCDWYIDKLELGEHIRLQTHLAQRHSTSYPTTKLHLHEEQEDHKKNTALWITQPADPEAQQNTPCTELHFYVGTK